MEILEKSSRPLNTQELLFKYLYYLPLFLFSLGLTLLGAWIYLRYKVPVYNVSSKIIIKNENSNSNDEALEKVMVFKKAVNLSNEIEIMKSRALMKRVVDSLGLNISYYNKGKIKITEIYNLTPFTLIPLRINDSTADISFQVKFINENQFKVNGERSYFFNQEFRTPVGEFKLMNKGDYVPILNMDYIVMWSPAEKIAGSLASALNIRQEGSGATILNVSYLTTNQSKGEDIVNRLIKEYDYVNVEDKNRIGQNTILFIDDRLRKIAGELDSVEKRMQDFKAGNKIVATANSSITLSSALQTTAEEEIASNLKLEADSSL